MQKPQEEASNADVAQKKHEETPRRKLKKPTKSLTSVLTARSKVCFFETLISLVYNFQIASHLWVNKVHAFIYNFETVYRLKHIKYIHIHYLTLSKFKSFFAFFVQVACGITTRPKDPIINIDQSDINNELAEVEYVEDIYKFYKLTETEGGLRDYMNSQPDLNAKMRAILVDWLIEVHRKFELMPESLYLTVNIVDRYLSMRTVPRKELQLVGISAMLIACKYEEIWPPEVNDLIAISDNAYTREQILGMEKAVLGVLGWYLTVPTPYVFLVRYTKASVPSDVEVCI